MKNYTKMVKLNKHDLDTAAETLPTDWEEFAAQETEHANNVDKLSTELDIAEGELKTLKAEMSLEIRSLTLDRINFKYKLDLTTKQLTVDTYKDLVENCEEVREKKKKIIKIKEKLITERSNRSLYRTARSSFDKKKDMIEVLARLHGQGWWVQEVRSKATSDARRRAMRKKIARTKPPKPGEVK